MNDLSNLEEQKERVNTNPLIRLSKSVYDSISRSPGTAIQSICGLFTVIILTILTLLLFPPTKTS